MRGTRKLVSVMLIGFWLLSLTACTKDKTLCEMQEGPSYRLSFKVVDSSSGEPIEDVSVEWGIITYFEPGDFETDSQNLERTNAMGETMVNGAKAGHSFRFEKDGYLVSHCLFSSTEKVGLFYPSAEDEGKVSKPTESIRLNGDEPIVMKMVRNEKESTRRANQ